ncbi:hypothetical protein [Streptomyces acidiscabies]|uniref:Uncharacterized protein n=1 Tax=Streptomyces acidiscabies TaxID=42234 RepID=A0AAP6BJH7_9ACTN|nr:hypothetical protein [Streptomyces acidiscabies]MBZ3913998.1 hypothetical protein [Streptomyces acidiscabies]MDX2965843.1 hypothetical protein [Streptomyces acidiscabies]MDX3025329.1 hypothetical protein [Streptomyces acidiscabies]MDX3795679.1 hypothetical protein [Streptomyces acidiscabies]GAQ58788.1 hypothetical protein a10_08684 [Streptomyces acidiscabies]
MLAGVCLRPDTIDPGVVVGRELDMYGPFGSSQGEYRQTLRGIAEGRIDVGTFTALLT